MSESTTPSVDKAEVEKPLVLLFVSEKNGAKVNFYETEFQRASADSGKKGLCYPAPDAEELLSNLPTLIQYIGPKEALKAILAKVKANCQAVFEASCKPKITSAGEVIKDKDGEPEIDFENFDLELFKKQILEGTISSESKAQLETKLDELMQKLVRVATDFTKHQTKESYQVAVLEVKGEIELTRTQIANKKRTRRTEAQMQADTVAA